jgi:hypothetical protein
MAVKDIEKDVEDAFIATISAGSGVITRAWKDGGSGRTLPAILIHCSPVGNHDTTPAGALWVAIVEVGVVTDSTKDKSQSALKGYIGDVRDIITGAGFVTALNAVASTTFLDRGIDIEPDTHTVDEDEQNQMSLTITCQITI